MVTLEQANQNTKEHLGRDIMLNSDFDIKIGGNDDFAKILFEDNLKQAILSRLKTALGELQLHPEYGSRLNELLGQPSTNETLELAKFFIREALLQEPRIDKITKLSSSYREGTSGQIMDIELKVKPIKNLDELNLIFSLFLTNKVELLTNIK